MNEKSEPLRTWKVAHAVPKKWTVSDLNANENSIVVETLELTYRYFTRRSEQRAESDGMDSACADRDQGTAHPGVGERAGRRQAGRRAGARPAERRRDARQALVAECVEQVLQILRDQKER